ncbi:TetR/AcrR family transcriptional regulator [Nonomuraea sp. PA05]|uniref:TetR/AcrR family transcriptional regulator n=1 Tax=Nonomuraea sp. PA05 TaxID=2604466 RepID=UPI0011D79EE0|nr:TetR family transcriptional regulator [Nonomuraea sp. PA05]TYB71088.1 TetR/AcrR family transcriptional regulator [Nonomuraea sp. PA05]
MEPPPPAARHLGPPALAVVGLVEEHGAVLVEEPHGLAALVDEAGELLEQAGVLEGVLPVVAVDVEHAALRAGLRRGLGLVDGRGDAVDVQDAGERQPAERRADALSRERIVEAAIELLDDGGESGLTFRRLAAHLKTGPGAIYHHVANKSELLTAATGTVLASTTGAAGSSDAGEEPVRALALAVFDAIDAHPWVGTQLSRTPSQPAMLRIFECVGQQVRALGVPAGAGFTAASALLNYILGVGGLNAANARAMEPGADRTAFLTTVSVAWASLDPGEYPFIRGVAGQLRDHDDREQFLAGVDLILDGIRALGRRAR